MNRLSITAALAALVLAGCNGSSSTDPNPQPKPVMYEVTLTNATAGQILSPPAVVLHTSGYHAWRIGDSASLGLEMLAEGGASADFMAEFAMQHDSASASMPLAPGGSTSIMVVADAGSDVSITVASMLVHTNDAFTGTTAWSLDGLMAGESAQRLLPVYDAGTETNSETQASMPGMGGEGFNAERKDFGKVAMHPGVVSAIDGLPTSALDVSHLFDQGVLLATIKRLP